MDRLKKRVAVLTLIDRLRHLLNEEREEKGIPAPPERSSSLKNIKTKIPKRSSSLSYRDQVEHQLPASSISNGSDIPGNSTSNDANVQNKTFVRAGNGHQLNRDETLNIYNSTQTASTLDKVKKVASEGWGILKKTFAAAINRVSREIKTSSNTIESARQTDEPQQRHASARDTIFWDEVLLPYTEDLPSPNKVGLSLPNIVEPKPVYVNSQEMVQGRDTPQDEKPISSDNLLRASQENSNDKKSSPDSQVSDSSQKELSQGKFSKDGQDLNTTPTVENPWPTRQTLAAWLSLKQQRLEASINVEQPIRAGAEKVIQVTDVVLRLSICASVVFADGHEKVQQERPPSLHLTENTPAPQNNGPKTRSRK